MNKEIRKEIRKVEQAINSIAQNNKEVKEGEEKLCFRVKELNVCGKKEEVEALQKNVWFRGWSEAMPRSFVKKYLVREGFEVREEHEE